MHFLLLVIALQLKYLCVMSKGNGRELKFCKQTKLNSILQLGETIHFQFIAGVWMWYPRELDIHWEIAQSAKPQRDLNLVQLFYLNVNDTSDQYLQLTHDRMTGFLVRTSNFTGIPANTGLLINGNLDHHMWIKAVGQPCGCLRRTAYRELEEREMLDDPGVKKLLWSLRETKHRMLHFIEAHNKLVVTFTQQKGNTISFYVYTDTLDGHKQLSDYPQEHGPIKGMFSKDSKVYYFTDTVLGEFDPIKETFTPVANRPLAASSTFDEKNLLNLLDLFYCAPTGAGQVEFEEMANFDQLTIILNLILVLLNLLLLTSVCAFILALKRRMTELGSIDEGNLPRRRQFRGRGRNRRKY